MSLYLTSTAFAQHKPIPPQYTCDGDNLSPPLSWTGLPPHTASLVLMVLDPDAPDPAAPKMTWVHWLLYNLPPACTSLSEGMTSLELPDGTGEGLNDWHRTGYGGPCPPIGRHRYHFKLFALDSVLPDLGHPKRTELEQAMQGHVLAETELIGTYQR